MFTLSSWFESPVLKGCCAGGAGRHGRQVCGVRARLRRACRCARLQQVLLSPASSSGPKPAQVQNRCFGSIGAPKL
eukprot:1205015-Prymnesium_polylepis.1